MNLDLDKNESILYLIQQSNSAQRQNIGLVIVFANAERCFNIGNVVNAGVKPLDVYCWLYPFYCICAIRITLID